MTDEKKQAAQKVASATQALNQALLDAARLGLKVDINITEFADPSGAGAVLSTDTFALLSPDGME